VAFDDPVRLLSSSYISLRRKLTLFASRYELNPKNETPFLEKQDKIVWRGSPDGIFVGRDQK
jgi:hypothetical protein